MQRNTDIYGIGVVIMQWPESLLAMAPAVDGDDPSDRTKWIVGVESWIGRHYGVDASQWRNCYVTQWDVDQYVASITPAPAAPEVAPRFDTATVSWSTIREAIVARATDLIASGEEFGAAERQATQEAIGDRPLPIREAQLVAMRTLIRKRVKDAEKAAAFAAFERQYGDRTGGLLEQVARSCATAESIRADVNSAAAMGFSMNMYIDYATRTSVEATRAAYRAASPAILAEIDLAMAQAYNAAKLPAHATSVAVEEGIAEIKARHDRDSDGDGALACLRVLYRLATTPTCRSMVCEAAEWVKGQQEQITYEAAAADKREWMFDH